MNRIEQAKAFATEAHRGQVRKYGGDPYITHPIRVAERVAKLSYATDDMIIAAYLHDVLEDTATTAYEIEKTFGLGVKRLVEGLTDEFTKNDYPGLNRAERKREEFARLLKEPREVLSIKLADILDNVTSEHDKSDDFWSVFLAEKKDFVALITRNILDGDVDFANEVAAEINLQIEQIHGVAKTKHMFMVLVSDGSKWWQPACVVNTVAEARAYAKQRSTPVDSTSQMFKTQIVRVEKVP